MSSAFTSHGLVSYEGNIFGGKILLVKNLLPKVGISKNLILCPHKWKSNFWTLFNKSLTLSNNSFSSSSANVLVCTSSLGVIKEKDATIILENSATNAALLIKISSGVLPSWSVYFLINQSK